MKTKRALRYLAPNLITGIGLSFGLLSLVASFEGRYVDAAWLIVYAGLTDRLDGLVARAVRGTSELGVQLDSFADFLNFGVAPAVLLFTDLVSQPELPFTDGLGRLLLMLGACAWVFGATFRLARYNISTDDQPTKIFFGIPTTLAAGMLVVWYLTFAKYAAPGAPMAVAESFGGPKLFGDSWVTPTAVWKTFPGLLVLGGYLMASHLRMPKLGVARSKAVTAFFMTNALAGTVCGFLRIFPEYMIWPPTLWLVTFLAWGQISREARAMRPPPLFPEVDPPPGAMPVRPEDDLMPEGDESTLDESAL